MNKPKQDKIDIPVFMFSGKSYPSSNSVNNKIRESGLMACGGGGGGGGR